MSGNLKKILLILLAAALLFGAGQVQDALNQDRENLGLTRAQPLDNAPPVLAFTTVALGGFRGLISNVLWARANDLQDEDKFFEMAQLADWITKLEPHFPQVWAFQAWNMAWNISVKFKTFDDRWRWLQRAIELLRDDGLRYNPNELLLYRELAWIFQNKIGASLDDASTYYKQQWADQMAEVFGNKPADFDELIHPRTDDQKKRAGWLRDRYKMDPLFMKEVDQRYGPLEWRLPEAHAIYWAAVGMDAAKRNPEKINKDDIITLRRVIYQSMLLSFQRGRLEINPVAKMFESGPNLDIIPKVNAVYEENMAEDEKNRDHIATAQRNFLRQAVYSLYVDNRIAEAAKWFKYLGEKYPDKTVIDNDTNSYPRNLTLEQYAFSNLQVDISETSHDRVKAALEGLLKNSYVSLVMDQDARAEGFRRLAVKVWEVYQGKMPKDRLSAIGLPPFSDIDREVRGRILDPQRGAPPQIRAILRTKLNLPAETSETNAVPEAASINPAK